MTARSWWQLSGPVEALACVLLGIAALTLGIVFNIGWLIIGCGPLIVSGVVGSLRMYRERRMGRRPTEDPVPR
jgi:hypothetical protein